MNTPMSSEMAAYGTSIVTFIASERTLAGMHALVHRENAASRTSIIAFIACEWTFSEMNTRVFLEPTPRGTSISAFIAGKRTLASMNAFVHNDVAAVFTSIFAFVAGERTLAGMRTYVSSESASARTSIVAFVAGKRSLILAHVQSAGRSRQTCLLGRDALIVNQLTGFIINSGQFAALYTWFSFIHITADRLLIAHFAGERGLDGAQNQILLSPQVAREFSFEHLSNAARRELLPRENGSADETRDSSLESCARNCMVD